MAVQGPVQVEKLAPPRHDQLCLPSQACAALHLLLGDLQGDMDASGSSGSAIAIMTSLDTDSATGP